jgi:hypothetical protein
MFPFTQVSCESILKRIYIVSYSYEIRENKVISSGEILEDRIKFIMKEEIIRLSKKNDFL